MATEAAFFPQGTVNIAATVASANVQLPGSITSSSFQTSESDTVLIYNSSPNLAFIEFGADATVTAGVNRSYPIPAGATRIVNVGPYVTWAAAILASATGTIYFSRGRGHQY